MATKQLQVLIKAVDVFTAPMRLALRGVAAFGAGVVSAAAKAASGLVGLLKHFTSLTGMVQAMVAGRLVGALANSFGEAADKLNELGDLQRRFEIPIEQLKELRFVARAAGLELSTIATALDKGQGALGEAVATGKGAAADTLRRLGIQIRDQEGRVRSIVDLMPELAIQLERLPDNASRLNALGGIFGKVDDDILQLFNLGAERIAVLQARAGAITNIFTPEQVQAAQRYRLALQGVQDAWLGLKILLFDQVGPFLADFFEKAAVVISNMPKLIGNVGTTIRDALFGSDEAKAEARGKLNALFDSVVELGKVGIINTGRILTGTSLIAMRTLFSILGDNATTEFTTLQQNVAVGWATMLEKLGVFPTGTAKARVEENARELRQSIKDAFGTFDISFSDDSYYAKELREAWNKMNSEIGDASGNFLEAASAVADFNGLLTANDASVQRVIESVRKLRETMAAPIVPGEAGRLDGMRDAAQELYEQTNNLFEQGRQVYSGIAQQISGNLSTALVNAGADVRNLGQYFQEFAANTLRGISQVITQMLVLRAVAGIGQALLAPAPTPVPVVGGPETVPGGVGLFSGRAVGAFPSKRPSPGYGGYREPTDGGRSAGGDVHIHVGPITVNGGDGGGPKDRMTAEVFESAVRSALRKGLTNNPSFRDDMRRSLRA